MLARTLLFLILSTLGASAARADEPARYSDRGRTLLGGSLRGTWYGRGGLPGDTTLPGWSVAIEPSWIRFVSDGIGVGAYVGYQATKGSFFSGGRYFDQQLSLGFSSAFEVWASGPWGFLLRPYLGLSLRFRDYHPPPGSGPANPSTGVFTAAGLVDPSVGIEQRDVRAQLGVRAPLVYAVSSSVVLGFGPDLLYEGTFVHNPLARSERFDGFRIGFSSFIGATF